MECDTHTLHPLSEVSQTAYRLVAIPCLIPDGIFLLYLRRDPLSTKTALQQHFERPRRCAESLCMALIIFW